MLFASFVSFVVYCAICTLKYQPQKPVEVPTETSSPELLEDPWSDVLDSIETSIDEVDDTELVVSEEVTPADEIASDEVDSPFELLPVDDVELEQALKPQVRCYVLEDWSDEDLYQVAKDNGLKPTKRWKRETLESKLNAILAA